ncbi:hypothetical protein 3S11_31 [uncultured Caudovirales phage]|uniref:Uncharacterized protein n=1 Tax=uncultured Caudovirales phage TaxID=2100421 RepID=A0A2H4J106_9CAUD|nr:hypothetical protein [Pseudomonas luteola]ASN68654.1 hypothetical protein 3S11_31 [uncultured Caudovirales phage]QEU28894.1 hypothetical protein FOB45_14360 [Pseudomonas luteola]
MADRINVDSATRLSEAMTRITSMFREHKFVVVSMRPGKDRTLDQNALWFKLYERIAQMTQIGQTEDARRYCKLHYGVPIMRRDCEEFRDGWNRLFLHLPYEEKLHLMGECSLFGPDGFPVTRLFGRVQGIEYTNRIVDEFTAKGAVFSDLLKEQAA